MPINVGPVDGVPLPGDPIRSAWATDISNLVADDWTTAGASRAGSALDFPGGATTTITWGTVVGDTHGYVTDAQTLTVPVGKQGVYSIFATVKLTTTTTAAAHVLITAAGVGFVTSPLPLGFADFNACLVMPLGAGNTVRVGFYNGGAAKVAAAELRFYRVAGSYL